MYLGSDVNKATTPKAMTFKTKATTVKVKDKTQNVRKCHSSHLL